MPQSFEQLCQSLELEGGTELYTLSEMHDKMEELALGSEVYTTETSGSIQGLYIFAEVEGHHNVVCFKNMAKFIVNEKWYIQREKIM